MKPSPWLPACPSKAYRELNPHLYLNDSAQLLDEHVASVRGSPKRIRQNPKPLMNKLESEWFEILSAQFPNYPRPRAQAKKYRLANGAWYRPDITASQWPAVDGPYRETAWECKGPKEMKNVARGILTIKFAAAAWPEVRFILVWKENGIWKAQDIIS